jgi:hypothetical protein
MEDSICPVCENTLSEITRIQQNFDASLYSCPRCGQFMLNSFTINTDDFKTSKHLISAWIRRQNKLGNKYPFVAQKEGTTNWFDNLKRMGFPQSVNEKLDTLLIAYAEIIQDNFSEWLFVSRYPYLPAEIAAKDFSEVVGLNKFLNQLGYVSLSPSSSYEVIQLSANGWFRVNELKTKWESGNSVFVAMWFNPCMDGYRLATMEAIKYCGYDPIFVDQQEFNGFIMDQVVSLIRKSRFIVADLTCKPEIDDVANLKVRQGVRGGVYWESGIAYGMGKAVIQTCKDDGDSKRRIHFDLDQYQTIFWKDDELSLEVRDLSTSIIDPTFTEKLALRILVTVGRGNKHNGE